MLRISKKAPVIVLIFACLSATAEAPSLEQLYHQHRWFELREAIKYKEAPALYRGTIASAFHDNKDAEKYLNQVIRSASDSKDAEDAHEKLADLYVRSGMSREAVQQFDALLKMKPGRQDIQNTRPIFASFSRYPDQSVGKQRKTTVHAEISSKGIIIPLSINGKMLHWGLDTGFNLSIMSESEARSLGLTIDNVSAQASDSNGGTVRIHTAVVPELTIGKVQLHDVPFLIAPDSQQPWNELPPGRRGLIGLPVAIALQAIGWKSDGTFEIGFAPSRSTDSEKNLCFDQLSAVTRVQFRDKQLDFILDTGDAAGSELWSRFASDFAAMVKQGTKSTKQINEVGGSSIRDLIMLPGMQLRVGGMETNLNPAEVFSQPVGDQIHHGLLGMDILSQAREVRIDFRSMTLQLLP